MRLISREAIKIHVSFKVERARGHGQSPPPHGTDIGSHHCSPLVTSDTQGSLPHPPPILLLARHLLFARPCRTTTMSAAPKYISATETAQLVREAKVNEVQVVDVRDDDVAGGAPEG